LNSSCDQLLDRVCTSSQPLQPRNSGFPTSILWRAPSVKCLFFSRITYGPAGSVNRASLSVFFPFRQIRPNVTTFAFFSFISSPCAIHVVYLCLGAQASFFHASDSRCSVSTHPPFPRSYPCRGGPVSAHSHRNHTSPLFYPFFFPCAHLSPLLSHRVFLRSGRC